jgi:two-component system chemotaxis response regulator CheB
VIAQDRRDAARLLESQGAKAAVEVFLKPKTGLDDNKLAELISAIRRLARAARPHPPAPSPARRALAPGHGSASIIGIVGSTGATRVLGELLAALPVDLPVPIVLVQHTERGFTERLACWLASVATLPVRLGTAGHMLVPGQVVLAPDDLHMEVHTGGRVHLQSGEPVDGFRPSGTVLLESLARSYGAHAAGLVLSGMGSDGGSGLGAIAAAGGSAVVEDPATAAVPGMPARALAQAGGGLAVPASHLASQLVELATARLRGSP